MANMSTFQTLKGIPESAVINIGESILPHLKHVDPNSFLSIPFWATLLAVHLAYRYFGYDRFKNVNRLRKKYGYTDHPASFKDMSIQVASEIQHNVAGNDFPYLYEFGWVVEFLKASGLFFPFLFLAQRHATCTDPTLAKVICESGHFCNIDPHVSHKRQQDTVCLMTAIMALPIKSWNCSLACARINEHHTKYKSVINSDTMLWLSWMWTDGPIRWINNHGWRKLEPFEEHAIWIVWRELSLRLGCKWVPHTWGELVEFKDKYTKKMVRPSEWNEKMSDAILDAIIFTVPGMFKPFARKCIISILDADVVWANQYTQEYSPGFRGFCFAVLHILTIFERYFGVPEHRILSPEYPNKNGLYNFPDYTYPSTPYYVAPTLWNRWGPIALLDRLRGLPVPSAEWGGDGIRWEKIGAVLRDPTLQKKSEKKVIHNAEVLMRADWGFRADVPFQNGKPLVVDQKYGEGYGSREFAYDFS
ncbi:MAG: hypothetical protein M1834_001544 [Cirrosporium novae-zelandiae]|nr:MAG: hypothetical protein M1834_004061 [Cirrosporium novae-zelandiae]KAI9735529.1 MAG: hypothetical protein M1834_001544 [Cirrosporium novae-zelandiae]